MAAKKPRAPKPLDVALTRLLALATKAVPPHRMAREVDLIVAGWQEEADPSETRDRLDELLEQLSAGVADAEAQLSDVDASEAAAVKQAGLTLSALVATRDAALRARGAL
jgi:hypothetical protein